MIILDREEIYDPLVQNIWCFKHVDDIVEGVVLNLGNMVSCYHFEVDGIEWRSSNIGKILMICRECLKQGTQPEIDLDLLRSKNIHLLGRLVRL